MDLVEYPMQAVASTVAALLHVPTPRAAEAGPIEPLVKDLDGVSRVAVLGVDALGLAIWQHWRARMPFLSDLAERRLAIVRSVMVSKTPVNFGCMVTGARVEVHGARTRDDAFTCETLFDVLRAHGRTSAGLGRKGWTGNDLLGRFADFSADGQAETDAEVEPILSRILVEKRPDFVIAQFGLTDETFHAHGPYSPEAGEAVVAADAWLARWTPSLTRHAYGVLILADHGQHESADEAGGRRGSHGTDSDEDCLAPLTWTR